MSGDNTTARLACKPSPSLVPVAVLSPNLLTQLKRQSLPAAPAHRKLKDRVTDWHPEHQFAAMLCARLFPLEVNQATELLAGLLDGSRPQSVLSEPISGTVGSLFSLLLPFPNLSPSLLIRHGRCGPCRSAVRTRGRSAVPIYIHSAAGIRGRSLLLRGLAAAIAEPNRLHFRLLWTLPSKTSVGR